MKLSSYKISLQVVKGPLTSKEFVFSQLPITIGRSGCDISLQDSKVSSKHAKIVFENEKVVLKDLQSKNGSFLNNHQIASHTLSRTDLIRIGDNEFEITWQGDLKQLSDKMVDSLESFMKQRLAKDTPESVIEEIFLEELKQKN